MDTLLWGALAAIAIRTPGMMQRIRIFFIPIFIACGVAVLIIDFPLHELYSRGRITQSIGYSIISIGFTALLLQGYCVNGTRRRLALLLNLRVLRSFGRYSYGIYVFHALLLAAMVLLLEKCPWFGHSVTWAAILFLGFLGGSYGVAFTSFHLYEKRFLALKSKFKASTS